VALNSVESGYRKPQLYVLAHSAPIRRGFHHPAAIDSNRRRSRLDERSGGRRRAEPPAIVNHIKASAVTRVASRAGALVSIDQRSIRQRAIGRSEVMSLRSVERHGGSWRCIGLYNENNGWRPGAKAGYRVRLNRIISETSMRDAAIPGGNGGSCAPRSISSRPASRSGYPVLL
jgi:hypothetical protein